MMNVAATDPKRRALGKGLDSLATTRPRHSRRLKPRAESRVRFLST